MWRRTYLALVLVRLYFALSPSYLHPDEAFQSSEVIAGQIFNVPSKLTWEFTSQHPVRSIFPLWLIYGWPLTLLKWIWEGLHLGHVPPGVIFYSLRIVMFTMSFVLEDWALYELLPTPRQRRVGILLVASSYVTWTWQSHTFSNSIETLLVLWTLVLLHRIGDDKKTSRLLYSYLVGFLIVLGIFNRITFPAFVIIPLLRLLPHFLAKPWCLLALSLSVMVTLASAIIIDTEWYTSGQVSILDFPSKYVFTPLNNLMYNLDAVNLALHGSHPWYQHVLINLPQLLGPAYLLCIFARRNDMFLSAMGGLISLSSFSHQEARFLIPTVPLFLASIDIPRKWTRPFFVTWILFNSILGILMGVYHQAGIVNAQLWLGTQSSVEHVFWWKTFSPPTYLLGHDSGKLIQTHDLMGRPGVNMTETVVGTISCESTKASLLVAPLSATYLDQFVQTKHNTREKLPFTLTKVWEHKKHLNLDDLDFGDDGVWPTIQRVIGRRGLGIWRIHKENC